MNSEFNQLSDRIPKKSRQASWQEIDGQIIVLTPRLQTVHELNETAGRIWNAIDGKATVGEIFTEIKDAFDAPEDVLRDDLTSLIRELSDKGLIDG